MSSSVLKRGVVVSAAMAVAAAALITGAGAASAATPPYEPDPSAVGTLSFYDSTGNIVTSGRTDTAPFAAYAVGSAAPRSGDKQANLLFANPDPGSTSVNWYREQVGLYTKFPVASGPASITGLDASHPVATSGSGDQTLDGFEADSVRYSGTGYTNMVQVRLRTANSANQPTATYDDADLLIDPSAHTWTQVYPTPAAATVPDAPTAVNATAGSMSATVSWTAPTNNGGAAITGYELQYSSDGGTTYMDTPTSGTSTSQVVTGLTAGTSYVFRVGAINSAGTGAFSSPSNAVTPHDEQRGRRSHRRHGHSRRHQRRRFVEIACGRWRVVGDRLQRRILDRQLLDVHQCLDLVQYELGDKSHRRRALERHDIQVPGRRDQRCRHRSLLRSVQRRDSDGRSVQLVDHCAECRGVRRKCPRHRGPEGFDHQRGPRRAERHAVQQAQQQGRLQGRTEGDLILDRGCLGQCEADRVRAVPVAVLRFGHTQVGVERGEDRRRRHLDSCLGDPLDDQTTGRACSCSDRRSRQPAASGSTCSNWSARSGRTSPPRSRRGRSCRTGRRLSATCVSHKISKKGTYEFRVSKTATSTLRGSVTRTITEHVK